MTEEVLGNLLKTLLRCPSVRTLNTPAECLSPHVNVPKWLTAHGESPTCDYQAAGKVSREPVKYSLSRSDNGNIIHIPVSTFGSLHASVVALTG